MRAVVSLRARFSRVTGILAIAVLATLGASPSEQNKKPSITLRANPPVGFSPLRVVITAELKGGANDYEDFYCASVEWEWGDDTKSENTADCDPYEPGKSEIKRRYVQEHTFRADPTDTRPEVRTVEGSRLTGQGNTPPTQFRVKFSLKQKDKVVGSGQTTVEIRSGVGSDF
jgi:hypothetical protein